MSFTINFASFLASATNKGQIIAKVHTLYQQRSEQGRNLVRDELNQLIGAIGVEEVTASSPDIRPEIRIIPVATGMQVAYGTHVSRAFPAIRDLNVVNGLPLCVAQLPDGETDFFSNELVLYGTEEFYGPEFVTRVHGVIGDRPVFSGYTFDDGTHWTMVDGAGNRHHHDEIDRRSVNLVCGKTVYAALDDDRWQVFVDGKARGGCFDEAPLIQYVEYAHPLVDVLCGIHVVNRLSVTGTRKGRPQKEFINFCPDIARLLADAAPLPASEPASEQHPSA